MTHVVIWGGISVVEDVDITSFEARRDVAAWPTKARDAMGAVYGDSYWQKTWHEWCDVMVRLYAAGGDVHLASLEQISCPVLILHGRKDQLIRGEHPATLHRRVPGSVLREVEDGGHNLHLTRAADFNRRVLDFIDS